MLFQILLKTLQDRFTQLDLGAVNFKQEERKTEHQGRDCDGDLQVGLAPKDLTPGFQV